MSQKQKSEKNQLIFHNSTIIKKILSNEKSAKVPSPQTPNNNNNINSSISSKVVISLPNWLGSPQPPQGISKWITPQKDSETQKQLTNTSHGNLILDQQQHHHHNSYEIKRKQNSVAYLFNSESEEDSTDNVPKKKISEKLPSRKFIKTASLKKNQSITNAAYYQGNLLSKNHLMSQSHKAINLESQKDLNIDFNTVNGEKEILSNICNTSLIKSAYNIQREVQQYATKQQTASSSQLQNTTSLSHFLKFSKPEDATVGTAPKQKSNAAKQRDISHIMEGSEPKYKSNQSKTDYQLTQLLNPIGSSFFEQNKRNSLFEMRKSSFPDLRGTNKAKEAQQYSPFLKFLKLPQSQQTASHSISKLQSFDELPITGIENNFNTAYSLKNYFPQTFLEEFLLILQDKNFGGNEESSQKFENKSQGKDSSGVQVIKAVHNEIQKILTNQQTGANDNSMRSSLIELTQSLKKAHPNLFSAQPSGRADVQILEEWLVGVLNEVVADKYGRVMDKFQRIDDALILSFNEIVRQVSYQCKERGKFLLNIFSCYFSLVKKISTYESEERRKIKIQNDYDKLLMMKTADNDVESKLKQIEILKEQLSLERIKSEELQKELKSEEEKEKSIFIKNEKLKGLNDLAKISLIKMKKEIEDLRQRLTCKEIFQQKKLERIIFDYKTTIKQSITTTMQTFETKQKLEEADKKLMNCLSDLTIPTKEIEEVEERIQLSFTDLIAEASEHTRMIPNEVIIKQIVEDKSDLLICQEVQTDPYLTLTFNKSIKVQTDLDFMDKKFDKVFSSKVKVEEYIRESQLKADLLSLEEFASEQMETSIDEEVGEENSSGVTASNHGTIKNIDRPILSNIFAGLPIKKIKKKMSKNNLQKFFENMGVLYNFLRLEDKDKENNKLLTSKNSLVINSSRKEDVMQKDQKSMREIKEVDELQEHEHSQKKSQEHEHSQQKIQNQSRRGSLIAASLNSFQQRVPDIKRKQQKQGSIKDLKPKVQKSDTLEKSEGQQLKDPIKNSQEITPSLSQSPAELLSIISSQKQIIERLEGISQRENIQDAPSHNNPPQKQGSFLTRDSIQINKEQITETQSSNSIQVNTPSVQNTAVTLALPQNKGQRRSSNVAQHFSMASIHSTQKKAIQFISNLTAAKNNGGSAGLESKKDQFDQMGEELTNFSQFYAQNKNISFSNLDIIDKDEDEGDISIDKELFQPSDLEQPASYQDNEFKQQIFGLLQLYNMEIEKNQNLRESLEELIKILRELYLFAKTMFIHIRKTQKHTHKQVIEGFIQQITSLKWKLPKEFDNNFEKEILKDDENSKKFSLKFSNKRSALRFIAHVQRSQTYSKMTIFDKNSHFGFIVANRIRDQGIPKKFAAFLPLKSTLKYIQNLVDERVRMVREKRLPMDQEMPIFSFNKFLQLFGFRRVAENKYTQFLLSVLHYQSIFRVNTFARLLTITNDRKANYTSDEMEKYFTAYEFIINVSTMGVINPQHSETDSFLNVALLKAMDYLKSVLEKIMPMEDIQELRQQLDQIKDIDQKSINKIQMVDFDVFMSKVLLKYRQLLNKTQQFVKNAFYAADLDGNERINLNEFLTLFRHIMPTRFNLMKCIKMFEEKADLITEEQKNLSFDKFTSLCIDFNLFTIPMQDKYIHVQNKEDATRLINQLKNNWVEEYKILSDKIELLKPFVGHESYRNWVDIIKVLEQRLKGEIVAEQIQKPLLIAHKLLNDELSRLIEEGKQGNEEGVEDEDDNDYYDDLFNLQEEDDNNDNSVLVKTMNNKSNLNNMSLTQVLPNQNSSSYHSTANIIPSMNKIAQDEESNIES